MRQCLTAYQTDPLSDGDPWNAVCARGDFDGYAGGGYDSKVTSIGMLQSSSSSDANFSLAMRVSLVNGPTAQNQPPFKWSTSGYTDRHMGQPDVFDFAFEEMSLLTIGI